MNTETITKNNSVFETKEQYQAFRAHWRKLHADGFHKRRPVAQTQLDSYDRETRQWKLRTVGYHQVSPLTAFHHLAFNIAIGRNPPTKAFSNPGKELWRRLNGDLSAVFGDTLTPEQKVVIEQAISDYHFSL